jgi:HlyD family secretion protein
VGDQVWQGQPLIYLPDLSRMAVRALVREIDLHRVVVGSAATVSVDAYPDLRLAGRVGSIGVLAETRGEARSAEKYFQVQIALDGEEPRLRPGMTARAEIRFAEARGVPAVPLQAVFREEGRDVCYVRRGTGFERRLVTVGLRTEEWAEVKDGVAQGEELALTRPAESLLRGAPPH